MKRIINVMVYTKVCALLVACVGLSACGFEQVDTGFRGVKTTFGEIIGGPLPEGLHFYNPFTSDIIEIEVREQLLNGKTQCFTKDTQTVVVEYSVTYYPDPSKVTVLYKEFGRDYEQKVVIPKLLGSIKDVVGQQIADELVGKRELVRTKTQEEVKAAASVRGITVSSLEFTNLDFDDAYEAAVEQKVVAIQNAAKAKNETVTFEEKAKQTVISANAEAESMKIRSQALRENKDLVDYEAVHKWDGKLPVTMMGNTVPFINIAK